jgi:hypothetical protein
MRIEFSSIASLQRITDGKNKYEAVYLGPDKPPEIFREGSMQQIELPEHVTREITRRFAEIFAQDYHTRELYLMEAKPCTI